MPQNSGNSFSVPNSHQPVLEAVNLERRLRGPDGLVTVLGGVSLVLTPGRVTVITGPNAIGKSTLVRLLAAVDVPDGGQIHRHPRGPTRLFAAVQFQEIDETLLPWRSNLRNATLGLEARGASVREAEQRVRQMVRQHELPIPLGKAPFTSSGGERQMLAVLRAAVTEPEILLLDEPFSRIGPRIVQSWWHFVKDLSVSRQMACLIVTHNVVEAAAVADEVLVLGTGAGRSGAIVVNRLQAPAQTSASGQVRTGRVPVSPDFVEAISQALDFAYV